MAGSFDGTTILEAGSSGYAGWESSVDVTEIQIPGGAPVLQTGGSKARRIALPVRVTTAQYTALLGKVGDSGTLSIAYGSVTAILESISSVSEITKTDGLWFCTLNLIKVG